MSSETEEKTAEPQMSESEAGGDGTQADVQAAAPDKPKGGLREDFLRSLESAFDKYELKNNCRVLANGFFLGERLLFDVLKEFGMHAARVAGGSAAVDEKMIRKLLGTDAPQLQYLVEGKLCIPGFFIPAEITIADFKNVALFRGSLIEATDFLHPRDPALEELKGVEVKLDKTGFGIYLKRKDQKIFADSNAVKRFHKALSNSPRLRRRYPEASQSLRASLTPLARLLQNAKAVKEKHLLFIPATYRSDKEVQFLSVGGFVFVLSKGTLVFCYELRGSNFRFFVNQELESLRRGKNKRIGKFELSRKRGAIIGAVNGKKGEKVLVHLELLMQTLELMMRRRTLRKKLQSRVTVYDSLKLLAALLHDTVRIEAREVPHQLLQRYIVRGGRAKKHSGKKRQRRGSAAGDRKSVDPASLRYRAGNGWVFFLHDKNIARGLAERPKEKREAVITPRVVHTKSEAGASNEQSSSE